MAGRVKHRRVLVVTVDRRWDEESRRPVMKWVRKPMTVDVQNVSSDDPYGYPKILARYWENAMDFMVVEPDIVIRPDVVASFLHCECLYGAYPYPWTTDVGPALGCTWFRAEFMEKYPDAMNEVIRRQVTWRQLDVVLMRHILAREYKEQPHVHLPAVRHLNPKQQLLPEASPEPMLTVPEW